MRFPTTSVPPCRSTTWAFAMMVQAMTKSLKCWCKHPRKTTPLLYRSHARTTGLFRRMRLRMRRRSSIRPRTWQTTLEVRMLSNMPPAQICVHGYQNH
eukprot:381092-Pyramimonas_sp.AAC.1